MMTDELYHIGTKSSGRYPRGSGEDPYQHVSKSARERLLDKSGRKARSVKRRTTGFIKRGLKQKTKERKQAAQEKEISKNTEAYKEQLVKKGSAIEIYKNRQLFTKMELGALNDRFKEEQNLRKYAEDEQTRMRGQTWVNKTAKRLGDFEKLATNASKAWNVTASVINAVQGEDKLRKINLGKDEQKKKPKPRRR